MHFTLFINNHISVIFLSKNPPKNSSNSLRGIDLRPTADYATAYTTRIPTCTLCLYITTSCPSSNLDENL